MPILLLQYLVHKFYKKSDVAETYSWMPTQLTKVIDLTVANIAPISHFMVMDLIYVFQGIKNLDENVTNG